MFKKIPIEEMKQKNKSLKELQSTVRINFLDCDPFGHLSNSRYIDYFYTARVDQLRQHYDFDLYELGKTTGNNWVVAQSKIAYFYPVLYNEEVIIKSRMIACSAFRVTAEYIMSDITGKKLHSLLWTDFIFVDMKSGKPVKHDKAMLEWFDSILYSSDDLDLNDFEGRTRLIQKSFRMEKSSSKG